MGYVVLKKRCCAQAQCRFFFLTMLLRVGKIVFGLLCHDERRVYNG